LNSFGHFGTSGNLPDGCTDKDIDAAFGDDGYEDENEYDENGLSENGLNADQEYEAWCERQRERAEGPEYEREDEDERREFAREDY